MYQLICLPNKGPLGEKIIDRIHNTRSSSKRLQNHSDESSPCKKGRPKVSFRYPPLRADAEFTDAATDERNKRALQKQLDREHPRKEIVLSLLRQTFGCRREDIPSESTDVSVATISSTHPALTLPYVVSLPFFFLQI